CPFSPTRPMAGTDRRPSCKSAPRLTPASQSCGARRRPATRPTTCRCCCWAPGSAPARRSCGRGACTSWSAASRPWPQSTCPSPRPPSGTPSSAGCPRCARARAPTAERTSATVSSSRCARSPAPRSAPSPARPPRSRRPRRAA
ncbi:unnamed protein product, partial [Prorocentrum cordatum]